MKEQGCLGEKIMKMKIEVKTIECVRRCSFRRGPAFKTVKESITFNVVLAFAVFFCSNERGV